MMDRSLISVVFTCILLSLSFSSHAQTCKSYIFSGNENFQTCSDLPVLNCFLHWSYDQSNETANIAFRRTGASTSEWIAWALNPSRPGMVDSQALLAYHNSSGNFHAYTTQITNTTPALSEDALTFGVSNIRTSFSNGEAIIFATIAVSGSLISTNQVWQVGPMTNGNPGSHAMSGNNMQSVGSINFQSGQTVATGGTTSRLKRKNTHGVLNAVSWGILMPMGAMIARYVKVFQVADPAWFYLHVACQSSGYVVGVVGWATGLKLGSDSPGITYDKHRNIGITLFTLGTLQLFALLLRPNKDHKYRLYWNIYHHSIGYAIITLSIVNIYEGFDILDPEKKWKRAYTAIIIVLGAIAAILEAFTWFVVLRRKKVGSDKFSQGVNEGHRVNGHGAGTHQGA